MTSDGHLIVFNRGPNALLEFDGKGAFVRTIGQEKFVRPHGFRIDPQGNLWATDVNGHTVTKMTRQGEVLLTLGTKGQAGEWNEAAGTRLLNEPTDRRSAPTARSSCCRATAAASRGCSSSIAPASC